MNRSKWKDLKPINHLEAEPNCWYYSGMSYNYNLSSDKLTYVQVFDERYNNEYSVIIFGKDYTALINIDILNYEYFDDFLEECLKQTKKIIKYMIFL